ncbi:MAG: protein O-mannosyl-transferase family [Anaerolineae bacterium]
MAALNSTNNPLRTSVLLALAAFLLYAMTAAPSVATIFDDSLEFQVVAPTLGIAHPSGYPLYTLVGKLATLLIPIRDAAGRLNLFSALAAAAAVGVLYLAARKLAGNRVAALVAAAAFAISPAWWSQATLAEVYALHGLLFVMAIYCLLRWEETRGQGAGVGESTNQRMANQRHAPSRSIPLGHTTHHAPRTTHLSAAALLFGLGLAHHRMIALLLPATLVFILWADPMLIRQPRRWLRPLALGLAPLLLYLYLPLRGAVGVTSLDGTYAATVQGTLDWILARGYSVFLTGNPFGVERDAGTFIALFLEQMGAPVLLAALLGIMTTWRFSTRRYVFLLLATAAQIAFGVVYKVQDVEVFFIPAFMLLALWAAWGLTAIFDGVTQQAIPLARALRLPQRWRSVYLALPVLLAAGILLFEPARAAVRAFPERDRSRAWGVYDYGQDMVASAAQDARIVGLLGETTLVRYFRDVLGQRPDLQVVPADAEAARFAAVDTALAAAAPVYLTRNLPGAAARYSLDAAGPLIAVSPKAAPGPAPAGQEMGAGIVLVDARAEVRQPRGGPAVRLNVTWAAAASVAEELKVSARLLDAAGNVLVADDRAPVHFAYPTTAWVPGETVSDVYDLAVPPAAPPGPYGVLLILYRAADGSEVGRAELPAVTLADVVP